MNAEKKKPRQKRESLLEAIRRHGVCRCGNPFDNATIGIIIKGLPVIAPVCSRQAHDITQKSLPKGTAIIKLRKPLTAHP